MKKFLMAAVVLSLFTVASVAEAFPGQRLVKGARRLVRGTVGRLGGCGCGASCAASDCAACQVTACAACSR